MVYHATTMNLALHFRHGNEAILEPIIFYSASNMAAIATALHGVMTIPMATHTQNFIQIRLVIQYWDIFLKGDLYEQQRLEESGVR